MKQKVLIVSCITLWIVLIFVFSFYSKIIFQEGNPWPEIKGITKTTLRIEKVVEIFKTEKETWYFTKSGSGREDFISFMNEKELLFVDQMGAGYFFRDANQKNITVIHSLYTRYFDIWKVYWSEN